MCRNPKILFTVLISAVIILFLGDITLGSADIPIKDVFSALSGNSHCETTARIIIDIRLIKAIVAILAGISLSVSGLQMQTVFRNPLAGPYVLGISSGASLGVALIIMGAPAFSSGSIASSLGIAGAAWIGSAGILMVIATVSHRIKDIMVVLILGIMLSSGVSAIVQIMQYLSDEQSLKSYVIWTMGSLGDVTGNQLWILGLAVLSGLLFGIISIKPLNTMMFGEEYARSMGIDIRRTRLFIFISTSLLAGTVTAFCGPIGFIGIAIPHVTRVLFSTANHRILMPATILTGASVMLLCDIISKSLTLPINSITALLGIPIVVWIVIRNKSITV